MARTPFVDQDEWTIDFRELYREAIPLATLIGLVVLAALVPFAFVLLGLTPVVFLLLTQFVLAVGTGVVLLYVVARGNQLAR